MNFEIHKSRENSRMLVKIRENAYKGTAYDGQNTR